MDTDHIVSSYDDELHQLNDYIIRMGGLVEQQLAAAVEALVRRDTEKAQEVVAGDAAIDTLEQELEDNAVRVIALRQPMANDLRVVVSALKISADLERIGDYAKNIAKRAVALNQIPPIQPTHAVPRMAKLVQSMIKDTLDAYVAHNADGALDVWYRDEEVDQMYTSLFRELLTYMMEDPRNITPCTHLLFIAKNIERMGDHTTNIAETIHFIATGQRIEGGRPKGDSTSFAVITPDDGSAAEGGRDDAG